jgi:hypothetical protein
MNSNLKDQITNICGIIFAVCTALLTATTQGVTLPSWVTGVAGVLIAISGGIIGYLTGKTPSGISKTDKQISAGNNPNPTV